MNVHRAVPVLLLLALAWTAAAQAANENPWAGKSRADVEALLGEPNKVKTTRDGKVFVYKLVRVDDEAPPPVGVRFLSVPGIEGTVGRLTPPTSTGLEDLGIDPLEPDPSGRGSGGKVETEESYSVSWDSKQKRLDQSWEERPAIRGKITLRFELDADGNVTSWSVSPKKAAAGS